MCVCHDTESFKGYLVMCGFKRQNSALKEAVHMLEPFIEEETEVGLLSTLPSTQRVRIAVLSGAAMFDKAHISATRAASGRLRLTPSGGYRRVEVAGLSWLR